MEVENGSLEDEFSVRKGPFSTSRIVGKRVKFQENQRPAVFYLSRVVNV